LEVQEDGGGELRADDDGDVGFVAPGHPLIVGLLISLTRRLIHRGGWVG
jgi:hypothetical protein